MNTAAQKNELIFDYSSGSLGEAKSLFVSMYLFLNSVAAKKELAKNIENAGLQVLHKYLAAKITKFRDHNTFSLKSLIFMQQFNENH